MPLSPFSQKLFLIKLREKVSILQGFRPFAGALEPLKLVRKRSPFGKGSAGAAHQIIRESV
jgi:hypothetical protein